MNADTLFLITKTYPYGKGEEYVTNELGILAKNFKKIIIYPNDYYGKEQNYDKVFPENVRVLNINTNLPLVSSNTIYDYCYLLKHVFNELLETDDKKNYLKNFKWNITNFWTQLQIAKCFPKLFNDEKLTTSSTLFYSYWFHKSAILLSILKDKKIIQKFVSRAHSVDLYHNDWGIINETLKVPPFKMFKLKNALSVLPVSQHGTDYLKSKFPKYSKKFITRYLGVADVQEIKAKPSSTIFHIVSCSGMDMNKRVHQLAAALLQIKHQVLWTHFGTGNLLKKVEELTNQFPANIKVQLRGNTPNKIIQEFYADNTINLFVNLSIVEGLPVSIMEAMVHEIPILATQVYGTPEAVFEGKNGFLLPVNFTMEELIGKLNFCIENEKLLHKMGLISRELYKEKFNADKNYTEFANHLASL